MNVFSEKSALFNSETQRWLKFIIHFLQTAFSAKSCKACAVCCALALRYIRLNVSGCHLFLAISRKRKRKYIIKVYGGPEIKGII